ncbi:ral guanine nucleotide dissociation stimulator-like 1 isoform X1 [Labeo rohita]|uniref:Ral guanine nucleotide dissociation stimulator-like 1 isoform X1 n=1 Tax=Labeo rohita TaxID=84645 RepID=A0A498NP35_LABRO|nr:ral guanine nucleotide dissociation stimulator-like 1 isoform X1 [Labeo rohita]
MRASLAVSGEEKGLRARLGRMRHLLCQTGHHVDVQMDEEPGVWLRSFHLLDLEERSEDPVQEWGEEVEDGAVYGVTLHREPIQPPPDAAENSSAFGFMQYRTLKVRRLKAATLERLVTELELFVRVVPFHCLGCIWSQRDKKENRNLAPTVRATIAQFNAVTNCVITSLLCPPSTSPPGSPSCTHSSPTHRAKIIEKWISVAQECHQLRNFSSLRAILSALQSNAVYRLKKTWAAINRESMAAFDHLCDTFPDENCVLVNREILVETPSSGEVPYLGTYLTVLTMLDTALSDNVEGGLINFEKRRKEFEILSQIRQLQSSCAQYNLHSHPHIISWINSGIPLSDQKSYELSRELEPPVDPCPSSPNLWSHRLITKKLTSLLSGSDNFPKKTFADQISVSSSGSSGSEMEDLGSPNLSPLRYKAQITSQDKTAQVIQRALEKHNLEEMNCQDFSLTQVLSNDKELLIPDKANVFYAMCTTANFDFVLRQRYKKLSRAPASSWSPGAVLRSRK